MAEGDFVIVHGRFSGLGQPDKWIVADILRIKDGILVEHWDVIQDEAFVHRDDDALIDELARLGIAYVPFFPLGGFTPLQSSTLSAVAAQLGATPMHVALAWLLHRAPNILLIPGTSSLDHLHENFAAAELALSAKVLAQLDTIGRRGVDRAP